MYRNVSQSDKVRCLLPYLLTKSNRSEGLMTLYECSKFGHDPDKKAKLSSATKVGIATSLILASSISVSLSR